MALPEEVRRFAPHLLAWPDRPTYAFAWKDDNTLLVSRHEDGGGVVYEVDLEKRTTRRVGGSGEYQLAGKVPEREASES